jgi:hypothetical protein
MGDRGEMHQNRWDLGIDRQGVALLLMAAVLALALIGSILWVELR